MSNSLYCTPVSALKLRAQCGFQSSRIALDNMLFCSSAQKALIENCNVQVKA